VAVARGNDGNGCSALCGSPGTLSRDGHRQHGNGADHRPAAVVACGSLGGTRPRVRHIGWGYSDSDRVFLARVASSGQAAELMEARLKQVCYFHNPAVAGPFRGYDISTLDPAPYFLNGRSRWRRRRAPARLAAFLRAEGVDSLYRDRDPDYMRFAGDFVDAYRNAHLVIMATYNPLHPEILHEQLPRPTKILGFIDDPYSTYVRGIPYLWAFDGAYYISPGYNRHQRFAEALRQWGCKASHWSPLVTTPQARFDASERFFLDRDIDVLYVGASYGNKITRLAQLKKHFGERLRVHGRWAFGGHAGWLRGLAGKPIYPHRVSPLTDAERRALYLRAKIGINMHLSNEPS